MTPDNKDHLECTMYVDTSSGFTVLLNESVGEMILFESPVDLKHGEKVRVVLEYTKREVA